MRSVIGPALLLLMTAGLLYTSFHTNKRILATAITPPRAVQSAALAMARDLQTRAAAFHADLGRWPDTPQDLDVDAQRLIANNAIQSLRFDAAGALIVVLKDAGGRFPATLAWTPRLTDERVEWACRTNAEETTATAMACARSAAEELAVGAAPSARSDREVAVPGATETCQRLGRIAYAAAQAREAGDSLDTFAHRPLIAFIDDPRQRDESKAWAQRVYEAAPQSPGATQRAAMREHRCFDH